MGRGLYGQSEGNETNPTAFDEHLADNAIVEGPIVKKLQALAKRGQFDQIKTETEKLRKAKWSDGRISAIVAQAMYGVRIK